jgi:predicted CXXCH cytochrome family protein
LAARRRIGPPWPRPWASALLFAVVLACSPVQRHGALDYVFDGVPPYLTPEERERFAAEEAARAAELNAEPRDSRRAVRKLSRFTHGPFAADECWRCHDLAKASGFRRFGSSGPGEASGADLAEGGRLKRPVGELCIHCHTDFAAEAPENEDVWLHGPVASGWCVLCHQPHSSVNRKLLYESPANRLCGRCHLPATLLSTPEHLPATPASESSPTAAIDDAEPDEFDQVVADCTRCHDPHRGPDRRLLKPPHEWGGEAAKLPEVDPPAPAPSSDNDGAS